MRVLPNFPMAGQMWSKARYSHCYINGRPFPCPRGRADLAYTGTLPPESETADLVVWDAELQARYDAELRRIRKDPSSVRLDLIGYPIIVGGWMLHWSSRPR